MNTGWEETHRVAETILFPCKTFAFMAFVSTVLTSTVEDARKIWGCGER